MSYQEQQHRARTGAGSISYQGQNRQQASSGGMGFVHSLNDAIRENPLAASLLGAGVCWMLFGNVRPSAITTSLSNAVKGTADTMGSAIRAGGEAAAAGVGAVTDRVAAAASEIGSAAGQVTSAARDALHSAKDAVPSTDMSSVTESVSEGMSSARDAVAHHMSSTAEMGRRYGSAMQQSLSESLDRQPLLLGALGLAIGAGIASAFPTTKLENELMGESGEAARERLMAMASETKEFAETRGKQILDDVKAEAQAQGLTPAGAKAAAGDVQQRIKDVASSARESLSRRTP